MRRSGLELHRNTWADWVAAIAFLLQPLAKRGCTLTLLAHVVHVDDTHFKIVDRNKANHIKRARRLELGTVTFLKTRADGVIELEAA